jgi:hypothetical protein
LKSVLVLAIVAVLLASTLSALLFVTAAPDGVYGEDFSFLESPLLPVVVVGVSVLLLLIVAVLLFKRKD